MKSSTLTLVASLLLGLNTSNANHIIISSSANWTSISTGSGSNGEPTNNDTITVKNGSTLLINSSNATCKLLNVGTTLGGLYDSGTIAFSDSLSHIEATNILLGSTNTSAYIDFSNGGNISTYTIASLSATNNVFITPTNPALGSLELKGILTLNLGSNANSLPSLIINGGDVTMGQNHQVNGDLRIIGGGLHAGQFTHTLSGNFINDASFIANTSNMKLTGTNKIISGLSSTAFYQLEINGTYQNRSNILTVANSLTGTGSLAQTSEANLTLSGSNSLATIHASTQNNTIIFNGTTAQSTGNITNFFHLSINNTAGVTLSNNAAILGVLQLTNGTFNLNGHAFTLLSTQEQTAAIAPLGSGTLSGNITVQRFAPGGTTGWAWMGSPVIGANIADWQGEIFTAGFPGATGSAGNFVSVYSYNESATGNYSSGASYVAPSSASDVLQNGRGYWVYLGNAAGTTTDITFDVTGAMPSGSIALPVTYTNTGASNEDGWNLVCNPYPSTINWAADNGAWAKTNMEDYFLVYNADINNYATFSSSIKDSTNGGSRFIASSQGFYVKAKNSNPFLVITENAKAPYEQPNFKSNATSSNSLTTNNNETMRFKVTKQGALIADECLIVYNQGANNGYDPLSDVDKLFPNTSLPHVDIYSVVDNHKLTYNILGSFDQSFMQHIEIRVPSNGLYHVQINDVQNYIDLFPQYFTTNYLVIEEVATGIVTPIQGNTTISIPVVNNDSIIELIVRFNIPIFTGLRDQLTNEEVSIQKAQEQYFVNFNLTEATMAYVKVINMMGQEVLPTIQTGAKQNTVPVNLQELTSGTYMIQVTYRDKTVNKKIVL